MQQECKLTRQIVNVVGIHPELLFLRVLGEETFERLSLRCLLSLNSHRTTLRIFGSEPRDFPFDNDNIGRL